MSYRSWHERMRDILAAINEIRSFVAGLAFDEFAASPVKQQAFLADFTIIREVARHIPPQIQNAYPFSGVLRLHGRHLCIEAAPARVVVGRANHSRTGSPPVLFCGHAMRD